MHTCSDFGQPEKVAILRARANMLSQAANSDDRTQAIIRVSVQGMSDNVKAYLPSIETMKRRIRRMREGNNLPAPNVENMGFEIPQE